MLNRRITFDGHNGNELAGSLAIPDLVQPKAVVLFAHCFTCGKDSAAASRIARFLAASGFAVLRFDFTGLGGSAGDFGNTGFASNVADLVAAADFLREELAAPSVLIGHSLGGTAAIAAAAEIPEVRAVATIGSPATPAHVLKNISLASSGGQSIASIGGRDFPVAADFVEKISEDVVSTRLASLKRALMVFHAPFDDIVSIDEAGKIFQAAKHPKSFVSLDDADHLLTRLADAEYVAETIAAWVQRYVPASEDSDKPSPPGGHVRVDEINQKFLRQVAADEHAWLADEPKAVGGDNLGPDPYEHLLAALGTCTSMTIRMYANRKKLPLEDVEILLDHKRVHAEDCDDCDNPKSMIDVISRTVSFKGDLDEAQIERLLSIADRCPVHRTLENQPVIQTRLGTFGEIDEKP